MKKKSFLILASLIVLVLLGSGCAPKTSVEEEAESGVSGDSGELTSVLSKAKRLDAYKYEMVVTAPDQPEMSTLFWFKGSKMKWEGGIEGQTSVYIIDQDSQTAYLYLPSQNMAMKMDVSQADETVGDSLADKSIAINQYQPVVIGSEMLNGRDCLVVEYSVEGSSIKTWIWKEYGLLLKSETTTAEGTIIMEVRNIEVGNIADSVFELPEDVKIMDIPLIG